MDANPVVTALSDISGFNPPPGGIVKDTTPPHTRNPVEVLVRSLAEYPGMLLWTDLRELLSPDDATRIYEAAATAVRATRG